MEKDNSKINYLNNLQHFIYTFKHIICINKVAIKYHVWSPKYLIHDADKLLMYIFCFWMTVKDIHNYHRFHSNHHPVNSKKKKMDWVMAIMDWECARFTKPDKPLNARETLYKYYPQCVEDCLPVLNKLGL